METPLILLHGALGAADQMAPLKTNLAANFHQVFCLDFSGHGSAATDAAEFSISNFAHDVLHFMERHGIPHADFFGYSMGGYVALELARINPEKVRRIATLGTKFDWSPEVAAQTAATLNPEKWQSKAPAFVEMLQTRHGRETWLQVVEKTKNMMLRLGQGDSLTAGQIAAVTHPTLVMVGTLDNTVGLDESRQAAGWLPFGQFAELPDTKHPFEQVDLNLLTEQLIGFFQRK